MKEGRSQLLNIAALALIHISLKQYCLVPFWNHQSCLQFSFYVSVWSSGVLRFCCCWRREWCQMRNKSLPRLQCEYRGIRIHECCCNLLSTCIHSSVSLSETNITVLGCTRVSNELGLSRQYGVFLSRGLGFFLSSFVESIDNKTDRLHMSFLMLLEYEQLAIVMQTLYLSTKKHTYTIFRCVPCF